MALMTKRKPAAADPLVPVRQMASYVRGLEQRATLTARLTEAQRKLADAQRAAGTARASLHDTEVAAWADAATEVDVAAARQIADGADETIRALERECELGAAALRHVDARLSELEYHLRPGFEQRWEAEFRALAEQFGEVMRERAAPLMAQMLALWEVDGAPCRRAGVGTPMPRHPSRSCSCRTTPRAIAITRSSAGGSSGPGTRVRGLRSRRVVLAGGRRAPAAAGPFNPARPFSWSDER